MQATPAPSSAPNSPGPQQDEPTKYPTPPQNMGSAPFGILVALFEKLQSERKQDRRKKLMSTWFNHWRDEKGHDLYPVLRLILPQKDRERAVYGLKEKNLAKTYIKLIPLGMRDPDAIRLLNWKKPTEHDKTSGDFPTVLFEVVSKRSSVIEGSLSVDDLNDILDELSKTMGKQDAQSKILQRVYNRTTPEEQRWIVRIILKDMVISVKETTVFSVFHPDAQDLYNTCSDLKKVAWELWDPSHRLRAEDKAVQLCSAFAPMLCKRPTKTIEGTVKEMGGSEFIIEEKLDGERMQLHKRGNEYFYCSRKGKDYTYLYGKHLAAGSLTPYIDKAFDPRVDDIILDGEMLVWDPVSQRNLPFGTLKTAALDKSKKEHNPRPCFKVFDLLYLNGQSLIEKSTSTRKKNMLACLKEIKGRIEFAVEYRGKTAKDVRTRMDEVMEARGEGLVIKHPASQYVLNGRNMDWIKVKPEYMDNMGETVDVLVVAANYGTGSRGGGVSTLICAVVDDRNSADDGEEPKYSSFVRIGSGLSFADYVWVRDKPWKTWDPKNPPEFLQTAKKSHEDKGDVYLLPEDSFILKVKAAEIVTSDQYHMGYTMRFPRALSIRDDLSIADCMSASAVLESLRTVKKRKMESDTGTSKKKRKIVPKKPEVIPALTGQKLKGVDIVSNMFEGTTFVVMADPSSKTREEDKKELSTLIKANGGTLATIPKLQSPIFLVYGGTRKHLELQNYIKKGIYDVIKPQWITDSIALGRPAPLRKKYFFHATPSRIDDGEYDDGEDDDDITVDGPEAGPSGVKIEDVIQPKIEAEDMDPTLADWFKVEEDEKKVTAGRDSDSETENDSDNADVANEEPDADLDDWFKVKPAADGAEPTDDVQEDEPQEETVEETKMGESETAMEYDQDLIFKHLCFYLDSPKNARKNGMGVKTKQEDVVDKSFVELAKVIAENGGKVVDLDEAKLTHVVIDKRDDGRRVELMKRTSKPKRRHLVIAEFIEACLDEATLLPEEDFNP
ncbi:ATP dependent DNA ligase domain-containing protein [Mycena rosella]|uniref:DNA ligase n=1 Tax=Mycena rosella TaxID=1033263 RepID=A0AAD7D077_MYCRO|nr:ATP dependent DNA ligase domain-containing protein [Mycena rosella]